MAGAPVPDVLASRSASEQIGGAKDSKGKCKGLSTVRAGVECQQSRFPESRSGSQARGGGAGKECFSGRRRRRPAGRSPGQCFSTGVRRCCPWRAETAGQEGPKVNQLSSHGNQSRRGGQRGNARERRGSDAGEGCFLITASMATVKNNSSQDTVTRWVLDTAVGQHLLSEPAGEMRNCRAVSTEQL